MSMCTIFRDDTSSLIKRRFASYSPIIEIVLSYEQSNFEVPEGIGLRTELSLRALAFAKAQGVPYERTDGSVPGVLFGQDDQGKHGNFHVLPYQEILKDPQWSRRLGK